MSWTKITFLHAALQHWRGGFCRFESDWGYFVKRFLFKNILKQYFILKKLFFTSLHQNNMKILKKINLKEKKINFFSNFKFFQKYFWNAKTNRPLRFESCTVQDPSACWVLSSAQNPIRSSQNPVWFLVLQKCTTQMDFGSCTRLDQRDFGSCTRLAPEGLWILPVQHPKSTHLLGETSYLQLGASFCFSTKTTLDLHLLNI